MENNLSNRMAITRKRGRQTNEEILDRGEPTPAEFVGDATPKLPPVQPMICKCCGRGQTPKVERTTPVKRFIRCTLCGGKMTIDYSGLVPMVARL